MRSGFRPVRSCWRAALLRTALETAALAALGATLACSRPAVPPTTAAARPPNLLLITLDTTRADHLGAYGYTFGATPNLDSLAADGVRFAAASSPVPLTLPAHASILSGLLPPRHGVRNNGANRFPAAVPTLATHLKSAGYRTGAFIGAFVLDRRFGLARGFDRYDDEIKPDTSGGASLDAERPGREVADRALAWLAEPADEPFFAWVHFYDPHAPYAPPEPYRTRFRDRPYDGEIAEVDAQVGRLLGALERRGSAGATVVVAVGDHGEALGEHGELTHGLLLYEPSLHVPLLLRAPGVPRGWTVKEPVSLVDLAPTVADLLGRPMAPASGSALDGRDIAAALRARQEPAPEDLYAESHYATVFGWSPLAALRRGAEKYIAAPRSELYELAGDPGETRNLVEDRRTAASALAARLAALASGSSAAVSSAPIDAETRAKLASLGYLGGGSSSAGSGPRKDPKEMIGAFRRFEEAHWDLVGGRFAEARAAFEKLVTVDPDNSVFVGQYAEACRRSRDFKRAIEAYRRAVALAPDDRDARYNLAVTLQEAGRRDDAVVALTTAIALDPGRPEAHNALGIALAARGELEGAWAQFARTVELDPRNARALNNLGNVLRDMKRPADAEQAYRRAITLAPDYPDPLNGLGTLLVQLDRPAEAVPLFDRTLTLAPELHEARMNRAIARELAGDLVAAAAGYREFLVRTGHDPQFGAQRRAAQQLLARLETREAAIARAPSGRR